MPYFYILDIFSIFLAFYKHIIYSEELTTSLQLPYKALTTYDIKSVVSIL